MWFIVRLSVRFGFVEVLSRVFEQESVQDEVFSRRSHERVSMR